MKANPWGHSLAASAPQRCPELECWSFGVCGELGEYVDLRVADEMRCERENFL